MKPYSITLPTAQARILYEVAFDLGYDASLIVRDDTHSKVATLHETDEEMEAIWQLFREEWIRRILPPAQQI
jgi:hypothetical protein